MRGASSVNSWVTGTTESEMLGIKPSMLLLFLGSQNSHRSRHWVLVMADHRALSSGKSPNYNMSQHKNSKILGNLVTKSYPLEEKTPQRSSVEMKKWTETKRQGKRTRWDNEERLRWYRTRRGLEASHLHLPWPFSVPRKLLQISGPTLCPQQTSRSSSRNKSVFTVLSLIIHEIYLCNQGWLVIILSFNIFKPKDESWTQLLKKMNKKKVQPQIHS